MPAPLPRLLVALLVLLVLARAGRVAWSQRHLAVSVWRAVRPRHVLGSIGLLALVLATSIALITAVPALGVGLGDLFGTTGNAVLSPVDVAAEVTAVGTDAATGTGDLLFVGALTAFLLLLAAMLPWFAFVEEEMFRAGAESWSLPRRVAAALVFGAVHLVMLVPLAAALAIAVAGFVYGEVYRRGFRDGREPPAALLRAFRPTRRSRAAVLAASGAARLPDLPDPTGLPGPTVTTPSTSAASATALADPALASERDHVRRQVAGLHASTVWHATFNTLVIVLVWLSFAVWTLAG